MLDIWYLVGTLAFIGLMELFARGCERVIDSADTPDDGRSR